MYKLYDYQLLAVNQLREEMRDHKRVCLCLPTGGGKTIIFSDIANKAVSKGKRVLVCVHRTELKNQAEKTTNATVVMVETLNNQIKKGAINVNDYDLIIIDEVHIGNFRKVLDNYDGYVIGATATPVTINKLYPLKNLLSSIVVPTTIEQLINLGRLSNPKTYARVPVKFNELKKVGGEYSEKSQNDVFNNRQVFEGLITDYHNNCQNKKGIIFCCSISHSIAVYESLIESGVNAFVVHSKMNDKDRIKSVNDFSLAPNGVMVNCGILTTGYDEPTIEFVMINRATTSLALWLQMIGRASRTIPNVKNSFEIYDYGMNIHTLGFWQEPRDWKKLFFADKKKKSEGVAPIKICPNCNAVNISRAVNCEVCDHEFEAQVKENKETELKEMVFKNTKGRYLYDLTLDEFMIVAEHKKYKQQFVERVIYHTKGMDQLTAYWDCKNYKSGYRSRRLDIFRGEVPVKNFKINFDN
jgi:superfamily II DNA or RNA helicase